MSFSLIDSSLAPTHLSLLKQWFEEEWGEVDHSVSIIDGEPIPSPILALETEGALAGGMAFTLAETTATDGLELWINAVLVAPIHRGKGLATRLITAAEEKARNQGVLRLFVYTDVPALYSKLGWTAVETTATHVVLSRIRPRPDS